VKNASDRVMKRALGAPSKIAVAGALFGLTRRKANEKEDSMPYM